MYLHDSFNSLDTDRIVREREKYIMIYTESLDFGSRKIPFQLSFGKRKNMRVEIHPDRSVKVYAPEGFDKRQILLKLKLKAPWIVRQIDYFNSFPSTPSPRRYVSGESHFYLGRQYRLKIIQDTIPVVKANRGLFVVHAVSRDAESISKQLDHWYRQHAEVIFAEVLQAVLPKFKRLKINSPELLIRKMTKRWGSCTTKGKVILNLELIKAPKGCIEYVIIHELCHLVYHNHQRKFQQLLLRMMPDWKKWKTRLEEIRP
jgi:predicted metal-dependent hydrolase